jgi:hypothetical protein
LRAGWKYIHGDVFRLPSNINLLCAILGSGFQIAVLTFSIFGLALIGTYSPTNRGAIIASSIVLYAFTSSISGYVSGYYYKVFGGTSWVRNVLLAAALFSGPMVATFAVLNTVAISYGSTQALPFGTIVIIVLMWALVTFPLTILGGIMAKNKTVGHRSFLFLAASVANLQCCRAAPVFAPAQRSLESVARPASDLVALAARTAPDVTPLTTRDESSAFCFYAVALGPSAHVRNFRSWARARGLRL